MPDVIKLLPDAVANQIAAGEVIQRPASVIKELLENAIDAKATSVEVLVKEAGKTLIQVMDNGVGMSTVDARMAFERHATSKIKEANDIFNINTKGFRGEALASIAAIAHVELKTKMDKDELGTHIIIEGSKVKDQEFCAFETGTLFKIKNLFYNVPARRNFLKSDAVEFKHIVEEFHRVAMAHPEVAMKLTHNKEELFNLPSGNFRQRIVQLFGKNYNQKLVPVSESTDIVELSGFIGKPEFARKTRGEQYIFVNNRFIRSPYFNHAIMLAYEELISEKQFPSYFLNLKIDPSRIDINIHPTKTEVKFEDERSIYAIIRTSVKQAIGKFNISPTLDFEQETGFDIPLDNNKVITPPEIKVNPNYNPFKTSHSNSGPDRKSFEQQPAKKELANFFDQSVVEQEEEDAQLGFEGLQEKSEKITVLGQYNSNYIVANVNGTLMIVDQTRAHQRVLLNKLLGNIENGAASQRLAFPETIEISSTDFAIASELIPTMKKAGLDVNEFGKNTLVVNGIPSGLQGINAGEIIEEFIEQARQERDKIELKDLNKVMFWIAKRTAIPHGQQLSIPEMENLLQELFSEDNPVTLPNKKKIFITLNGNELDEMFSK